VTISADVFDTTSVKSGLKKQAVRGGAFLLASRAIQQVIRIVSTVVIMRILTPEDFGLIAMVAVITNFMGQFLDLGLSQATVQRDELAHQQVTNLFWVNVGMGILATIIVVVLAPAIVWFYHEPRLYWLTMVLAIGFLFTALTVQHQALMQRQLRIGTLSMIYIISTVLSAGSGIAAVLLGAGVWALVCMPLVDGFTRVVAVWLACPWRPGLPARGSGTWRMLVFGGNVTAATIVNYFSGNTDHMFIGWQWGAGPLGLYDRAYSLMLLPIRQITTPVAIVAIPTLSRLQTEPERYRRYYLRAVSLIAFVTVPAATFLLVMSAEVITVVFGQQWMGVSKIFAILGVCALAQPILISTTWLFVSSGRPDRMFRATAAWAAGAVASFAIGLPFGPIGVAAAYTIFNLVCMIPFTQYAAGTTPVKTIDIMKTVRLWFVSGLFAGCSLYVLKALVPPLCTGITGIVFGVFEVGVIYLGIACIFAGGTAPLRNIADLVRQFRREKC
jgi:O-antigen/teichoic acid export membrane protein